MGNHHISNVFQLNQSSNINVNISLFSVNKDFYDKSRTFSMIKEDSMNKLTLSKIRTEGN